MIKSIRLALTLIAALSLGAPPTAFADTICETYSFRYLGYYQDCACWTCGGWSLFNCTECVDTATGSDCHTNGSDPCDPAPVLHPV